jgi:hypothetical protein
VRRIGLTLITQIAQSLKPFRQRRRSQPALHLESPPPMPSGVNLIKTARARFFEASTLNGQAAGKQYSEQEKHKPDENEAEVLTGSIAQVATRLTIPCM